MSVATGPGFIALTVASNSRPGEYLLVLTALILWDDNLPNVNANDFVILSSAAFDAAYNKADGYAFSSCQSTIGNYFISYAYQFDR